MVFNVICDLLKRNVFPVVKFNEATAGVIWVEPKPPFDGGGKKTSGRGIVGIRKFHNVMSFIYHPEKMHQRSPTAAHFFAVQVTRDAQTAK